MSDSAPDTSISGLAKFADAVEETWLDYVDYEVYEQAEKAIEALRAIVEYYSN